jgi:hypothetical protein
MARCAIPLLLEQPVEQPGPLATRQTVDHPDELGVGESMKTSLRDGPIVMPAEEVQMVDENRSMVRTTNTGTTEIAQSFPTELGLHRTLLVRHRKELRQPLVV